MATRITVDEQLFERQGIKVVITEDGQMRQDGAIVIRVDTDGDGFNRTIIDTMAGIFVEELSSVEEPVEISAAPWAEQE